MPGLHIHMRAHTSLWSHPTPPLLSPRCPVLSRRGCCVGASASTTGLREVAETATTTSSDTDFRNNIVSTSTFSNRLVGSGSFDEYSLTDASLSFDDYSLYSATRASRPPGSSGSSGAASSTCCVHQGIATEKGYKKLDSQDRFVAMQRLPISPCVLSSTMDSSTTEGIPGYDLGLLASAPSSDCASAATPASSSATLTCIFDGHGSSCAAAETAAVRVGQLVAEDCDMWSRISSSSVSSLDEGDEAAIRSAWRNLFQQMDDEILEESRTSGRLDGTTALAGLQAGRKLFVANAGDSRAVLSRNGMAIALSQDHSPGLKVEKERVLAAGGNVQFLRGTWRVLLPMPNGKGMKLCAMSRCLGDRDFKEPLPFMTCEPDVTATILEPSFDEFTIFASDGIWSFVQDQEAVDCVSRVVVELTAREARYSRKEVASAAAHELVCLALRKGSMDDISVVVNLFEWS